MLVIVVVLPHGECGAHRGADQQSRVLFLDLLACTLLHLLLVKVPTSSVFIMGCEIKREAWENAKGWTHVRYTTALSARPLSLLYFVALPPRHFVMLGILHS